MKTISSLDVIRERAWMYISNPKDPLLDIISTIADSFLRLKIREYTICEKQSFFIIKSKQDWLDQKSDQNFEAYFHNLIFIKGHLRALQGEVFLTAFYYQFYTIGNSGEYGDQKLINEIRSSDFKDNFEDYGRVLLVSKARKLPKEHGINFEQGQRPISELENERKWLDIAIQQAMKTQ